MGITATGYEHITLDETGVAYVNHTRHKLVDLIASQKAHGYSPEELYFQFPHLSLGAIHSALAYYWDHAEALDQEIQRRWENAEQCRKEQGPTPFGIRMKHQGLR